ncbi:MAG: winged helix-turn-helix transcriptional regulator [Nitrospira sp.]|nr:winged helix-turn-helix transcriptional regulator [Nitrospira sp.]
MNTERSREDALTLEILDTIEKREDVSQRYLARHLGVALGLANSYLKRCIRKGYVKVTHAPANRYLYYLTPKGFAEKSRLTARYLSFSLTFYRKAGESCLRLFDECERRGFRRLLLCGVSDLAEIATLRAMERDIAIVGYFDPVSERKRFLNRLVWQVFGGIDGFDACMLTDLNTPQASYQQLQNYVKREQILVPDVLSIDLQKS